MANFLTAMEWLREGHKIRRPMWNPKSFLHLIGDEIFNDKGQEVKFNNINSAEARDWEIYEEESKPDIKKSKTKQITDDDGIVYEEVDYNTYLKSSNKHRIIKSLEHQYFVEIPALTGRKGE